MNFFIVVLSFSTRSHLFTAIIIPLPRSWAIPAIFASCSVIPSVAGTTRDAIDTTVKRNGQEYIFIDTAGLRRKSKIKEELERYSIIRAVTAVERADVVIIVIDATEGERSRMPRLLELPKKEEKDSQLFIMGKRLA